MENLFDTEDDPANEMDDEFTPSSWRWWTPWLYTQKVTHLASVLVMLKPDVAALEEVENRRVLDDLVREVARLGGPDYRYVVHREGPDHRGVDVAALSVFEPQLVRWLTPVPEQRDILRFDIAPYGRPLTIMVNHWKSRWGGEEESAPIRAIQARALRREIDTVMATDSIAAIVVAGDLNENLGGPAQSTEGGISTNLTEVLSGSGRLLYNLHASLPSRDRGTYYYHKGARWNSFDSISVSASLLANGNGLWKVVPAGYRVVREPRLLHESGYPLRFRKVYDRKTKRRHYERGYSDHLPVILQLSAR